MFRESDAETGSVELNLDWALRTAPPGHIIHVCGPAFSGACLPVDVGSTRYAQCERCGARADYASLARWIRRLG
jgi:hypothetical protein